MDEIKINPRHFIGVAVGRQRDCGHNARIIYGA